MDTVSLLLIRINKFITALRILGFVLIFIPFPFFFFINNNAMLAFWTKWFVLCFLLFIIQYYFLKRYTVIGRITIDPNKIEIMDNYKNNTFLLSEDKLRVNIIYRGYKGQKGDYNPMQIPLLTKEGIGTIIMQKDDISNKFKFLAEKDYSNNLKNIANQFHENGNIINLILSKGKWFNPF